jgi:hypothetical protein
MRKGRWPKSPVKVARKRAQLEAAERYKAAVKARDGSSGPASPVRRIDPKDYKP